MSWARQLIENRLQNARENLDVLDKNLKRMTGKSDASMPNSARRRIGGPTSAQLSVKARLQPPVQSARRTPASARVDQRVQDKNDDGFESEEEAEDTAGVQTLKSNVSVAAKANEVSSKVLSDDTTKQRGRRFFGMLTQTLHSFQEKENEKKPALEKRAEIEKKVEAAEKLEKAEAAVERRELFKERMLREEEIAQLNAKMDRAQMLEDWESAMQMTKGNIMTNSRPPIFYRPKTFNSRLTELQKRTEKYIDSLIFEREEEMKQELHILPSEENSAEDEEEERGCGARNKAAQSRLLASSNSSEVDKKIGIEDSSSFSQRLGSNIAGKVTNGLEDKSATKSSNVEAAVEQSVVSSEKHALTSGNCNGNLNETPKSLAEELGAPSEDIENLLVEQPPPTELPKKESATSVASAVVMQTDFGSSKVTSELDVKESPMGSKSDKSSPTKKQRNYRQRSKSVSNPESRRKRKEASPVRKASKSDTKKAVDKKESHRRKSERSSSRSKPVTNEHRSKADAVDSSKRKSETAKEREKVGKRNRSTEKERGRAEKTDRSKERKENVAAVKKQRKHSSSRSSSSSSSPDEPRKKAPRPTNQKEKKTPTCGETKTTSKDSKKDENETETGSGANSLKLKSYNTTFGSELKKVKQLTEKDSSSAASTKVSKGESLHTIPAPKPETVSATKEPLKEIPLPEPEKPSASVQSSLAKSVETPKTQIPQIETAKPAKVDVPPVIEYPTHSPLKTPALYKNVNPSLLPVDHENLTFKITSAFQAAPTPPNLPPVYKTLSSVAPVVATENVMKPIPSMANTSEAKKPETADSNQSSIEVIKVSSGLNEKKINGSTNPVSSETAKEQIFAVSTNSATTPATNTNSASNAVSNKTAAPVKKRRSVSSSSSSSSGSDHSSVGRQSREKRKRRSSPTRRHPRRASSRKRRRSHSRRRRRGSLPRKVSSTSRHHRRRPSRERRRRGGSRRRRRSASGERRRRRSPSSSSTESSSSAASGISSDESSKSGSVSPRRPGARH